jgi:alpha-ketoglutarate-dependent 2,4-dichlorophenoxyacetate dioxygenase
MLSIIPIRDGFTDFVGKVRGLDLSGTLSPEQVRAIEHGMDHYGVLVFRDQDLDDRRQVVFGLRFGDLEENGVDRYTLRRRLGNALRSVEWLKKRLKPSRKRAPQSGSVGHLIQQVHVDPRIPRASRDRAVQLRNQLWHTDSSFKPIPAKYSMLYARSLPGAGGETEFADMRAAWDALLVEDQREIFEYVTLHSEAYSDAALGIADPTRVQPLIRNRLVRRHPVTGRFNLYLASHAGEIEGMPVPEARLLLRDLIVHATQPQFVYRHHWRPGDLVMWDNRVTMHRGRRYNREEVRDLHRVTVADVAPTLEQPL